MNFINQYSQLIIIITIAVVAMAWALFIMFFPPVAIKKHNNDLTAITNWLNRERWEGGVKKASLISWRQTDATNNLDCYFIFTFNADLDGKIKQYSAATVVRLAEVEKLREGLSVTVKYDQIPPQKMAVISVDYE